MLVYIFPLLAMLSFGLSPLFYKYVINLNVNPVTANQVRVIMTFFIMMVIFVPEFFIIWRISAFDLLMFALISFFGVFLGDTVYFYSLKYTDVSITAPLSSTYAIMIAIIMFAFFNVGITAFEIIGGIVIVIGIWIIQERTRKRVQKIGIFLALLSALFYSMAIILMDIILPKTSVYSLLIFRIIFSIIFLLPISIPKRNFPRSPKVWALLGIGGFFGIGIGIVFMLYSMDYLGVVTTGLFSSASPMITSFLGILLFKERKNFLKILGISLILAGLVIISY